MRSMVLLGSEKRTGRVRRREQTQQGAAVVGNGVCARGVWRPSTAGLALIGSSTPNTRCLGLRFFSA